MALDPLRVAVRLGFEPSTIGRLRSRGHLSQLSLTEAEMRRRLYLAHRAHLQTTKGEGTMDVALLTETRKAPNLLALGLAAAAIGAGVTAGVYQGFGASGSAGPVAPPARASVERNVGGDGCVMVLQPHPC